MSTTSRRVWVLWGLVGAFGGGCTGGGRGQVFVVGDAGLHADTGVFAGVNGITLGVAIGPTRSPEVPPPPISGGTLLITRDGRVAVASDPDRDRVWFVDLPGRAVLAGVSMERGDEPGRLVEDAAGRVHVALRRGGALVTLDVATRAIVARRAVCAAPRGIAFDGRADALHVACAGGELVTLPAGGGAPTRTLRLERDLRDVIVDGDALLVTRFRDAELLRVGAEGVVARRLRPATMEEGQGPRVGPGGSPGVAWRTVARSGGAVMLHQRAQATPVRVGTGGYGSGGTLCRTGIVQSTVSVIGAGSPTALPAFPQMVLAVDLALNPTGTHIAVAAPGNAPFADHGQVFELLLSEVSAGMVGPCTRLHPVAVLGQAVAVAYAPDGELVVQTREPATIRLRDTREPIVLSAESHEDTGHTLFHSNAGASMACASCHPEGGEDGHVWEFQGIGARRTQSLRGGVTGMAPFHWDGDMATFTTLVEDVFGQRMNGGELHRDQVAALERWSNAQAVPPASPPRDAPAVERGRALFADPSVGCASCHGGARYTNNATVSVGTGAAFQVPSLTGLAWRTPLMHDGCAASVRDRFGPCGGGESHGHTAQLAPAQLDDLVAYLETL